MTKKHFIALADAIREHQHKVASQEPWDDLEFFTDQHIECLADFCQAQNPQFNRARWLNYIAGERGPNGGKVKAEKADKARDPYREVGMGLPGQR